MSSSEESQLTNLSEEELFALIGQDVVGRAGAPLPLSDYINVGKSWFEDKVSALQSHVCAPRIRAQLSEESDELKLIREIIDLVGTLALGVRAGAIAAIIVKLGLKKFCGADQNGPVLEQ